MNTASALKMINNASAISKKMKMPPLTIVIVWIKVLLAQSVFRGQTQIKMRRLQYK